VIRRYPHPGRGFTQGLIAGNGSASQTAIWESTGLYGESALCRYRLGHRQPQRRAPLPPHMFGEGICRVGSGAYIWQLTWQDRVALRWDARTLELVDQVSYDREGWGICATTGGVSVITSDGSGELVHRDPDTLDPLYVIDVRRARPPGTWPQRSGLVGGPGLGQRHRYQICVRRRPGHRRSHRRD
jgi:glutamine cyclotransferase